MSTKIHVLTDIDDTVLASRMGGTDCIYNNHQIIPGVISLINIINTSGFTTYLSARPSEAFSTEILINKLRNTISEYAENNRLPEKDRSITNGESNMILGSLSAISGATIDFFAKYLPINHTEPPLEIDNIFKLDETHNECSNCNLYINDDDISKTTREICLTHNKDNTWLVRYKQMGINKFIGFCKFSKTNPEYEYIFIGDAGQGDILNALLMAQQPNVKYSLIRNIQRTLGKYILDDKIIEQLKKHKIYVFNNYLECAILLNKFKYISNVDVQRVKQSVVIELKNMNLFKSDDARQFKTAEINRSIKLIGGKKSRRSKSRRSKSRRSKSRRSKSRVD